MLKLKTRNSDIDVLLNVRDIKKSKAPTSYLGIGIFKDSISALPRTLSSLESGEKV